MIPNTLFRYLARFYIERFILIISITSLCLLLSNTFDTLNSFRSVTFTIPLFISIITLKLPFLIIETIPLLGFISTLVFLHSLTKTNQLVSILATGTSIWKVLLPVSISGILIGTIATCLLQPLSSILMGKCTMIEAKILKSRTDHVTLSNSGVMISENLQNERRIIIAKSIDAANKKLFEVTILFIDDDNNFISRLDAQSAILDKSKIVFYDIKTFNETRSNYKIHDLDNKTISFETNISIERLTQGFNRPELVSFWQLPNLIEQLRKAGISVARYNIYYYKQLFKPLMMVAVGFMAFCFISPKQNRISSLKSFVLGVATGFVIYLLSEIFISALMSQGFHIIVAIFCPILIIILLSVLAILHLHETG